jgi:uncharacterized protein
MTLEEITSALKSADTPPDEVLRAGLAKADQLAPTVFALVDKLCDGIYLLPEESTLLLYGLTLLAATRHDGLYPYLLKLSRQPGNALAQVFPIYITYNLAQLLLSVWDGDADAVFEAIEDKALIPEVRSAWFEVLARLTFDGAIARDGTLAFLTRLERDDAIDDQDTTWLTWEKAVVKLGARDLEPALQRVWLKPIFAHDKPEVHAKALAFLHHAASDPTNPALFDEHEPCAIDDPAKALARIGSHEEMIKELQAEEDELDDDPAKTIRLTEKEINWLSGFLESGQVPVTAMPFVKLDGFFTALVIGPTTVMPSVYLPVIWGTEDGSGPVWDSLEQLHYFMGLLTKHWNAITARRNADARHLPHIEYFADLALGKSWAEGFAAGMTLSAAAWDSLIKNEKEGETALHILGLAMDDGTRVPDETRAAIIEEIPDTLREIASFWRAAPASRSSKPPSRSRKIGRNEPCPCGSGKKYKKCCGAGGPPTLH